MAQYEEGPGSVLLNMDLIQTSPQANKPFLVITGVSFRNCREDGLPTSDEFDRLYVISICNQTINSFRQDPHSLYFSAMMRSSMLVVPSAVTCFVSML